MKKKSSIFTTVPGVNPSRNMFDLSHEVKQTGKFGYLYPCLLLECMPGDNVRDQLTVFLRAAPMLAPIMHLVTVKTHSFFVPIRLICKPFERFITGGQSGTEDPILPYCTPDGIVADSNVAFMAQGTLWDYLGLPPVPASPTPTSETQISILPFRAYMKIWSDWYRDPNFDQELDLELATEGDQSTELSAYGLQRMGWGKDYFTSCLEDAQRGDEVLMPLSGFADMLTDDTGVPAAAGKFMGIDPLIPGSIGYADTFDPVTGFTSGRIQFENSGSSINDFRLAMAMQRWMEISARSGSRYVEMVPAQYGIRPKDYRLQRSEYLGGGSQQLNISQVLATSESDDVPIGDMAGHGVSVGKSNRFSYTCTEHGYIITILSVMPKPAYSQGIHRLWSRINKYEFAFPILANLGEQPVLGKEIFFSPLVADDDENQSVFGYIPRYAEYKFMNDRIAGDFRTTLGFWHLGRNFTARPTLDSLFTTMNENDPSNEETYRRIFANQDGTDYFWIQMFHHLTARRPLSYFGVPSYL